MLRRASCIQYIYINRQKGINKMILSPLDTEVMRGQYKDNLFTQLGRLHSAGLTKRVSPNGLINAVVDGEEVPSFVLPIKSHNLRGDSIYYIDLRKSNRDYRVNEMTGVLEPLIMSHANFLTHLAAAEETWVKSPGDFSGIYNDAGRVYALWLAKRISNKLVLAPQQTNELIIYFAYYWMTATTKYPQINDAEYNGLVNRICQMFGFHPPEVYTTLDSFQCKVPTGFDNLCEMISATNHNPKLQKFSRIAVQTIALGSWFGQLGREMSTIMVEYPPYFMTVLYHALSERTYRDTPISKLGTSVMKSERQKAYTLILADLFKRALTSTF